VSDLVEAVQRQAPGTWLPLKVRRGAETIELVAKFPARAQ
jgi:S1-C subfamily serine protease